MENETSDASGYNDKPNKYIFISHASADDDVVKALRIKLELLGLTVWVDSRNLHGGTKLEPVIEQALRDAEHVIAVLSPKTINSPWVRKEINLAEAIAAERDDYQVIPLMLPGIEPAGLMNWFDEEPVGVKITRDPGQLEEAIPQILAALGQRLPDDAPPPTEVETRPLADLLVEFTNPKLEQQQDGTRQLTAEAELTYSPADLSTQREVKSRRFRFVSPIGRIERDELRWYLEKYYAWPVGLFRDRAERIEERLPHWGKGLFDAVLSQDVSRKAVEGWQAAARADHARRLSMRVDAQLLEGASAEEQAAANEAASALQGLPWELLHDDKAYLNAGKHPAPVRRRLPNYDNLPPVVTELPIRILLLSPRPEEDGVGYIDHRASALPLVQAVESLGDLVELTVLTPPTLGALEKELKRASDAGQAYHVLHFDGHGVYDPQDGLGALCFENPGDSKKLESRRMQLVDADQLANKLRDYRIPLVFLEACQTAQAETDPNTSVAARLLQGGTTSVVAMSHSVLVETARRFVTEFYGTLAEGQRVGRAILAGQRKLMEDTFRMPIMGAGELHLQDWFVPILYQEQHDPQLFAQIPSEIAQKMRAQQRGVLLGELPETPPQSFIGRSRELLALERLLEHQPWAVIRGQGGAGKTALAVELARWLVRSNRFDRCAFVSVETYLHDRAVLDTLGKQLEGEHYSVAEYGDDLDKALQPITRTLENHRCLLVLDNLESLLADGESIKPVLRLIKRLLPMGMESTRLLFTTRERLPTPFAHKRREIELGALSRTDAQALVMQVMRNEGLDLKHDDQGRSPEEVDALVDSVGCHARALVLLAGALSREGVTATTGHVQRIMRELHKKHPAKRELSLFASVELSLQRLSPEVREQLAGLAVFHDGGNVATMSDVLDVDTERMASIKEDLIEVGLATARDYSYLRLDPALPDYLELQLDAEQRAQYHARWMAAMGQLVDFLSLQQSEDAKLSAQLTLLELPNLMAFIHSLAQAVESGQAEAAALAGNAGRIEQMLAKLNRPQALARVVALREQAGQQLGEWSHARFENERLNIDRLLQQNVLQPALESAQQLLQQCEQAGEEAYKGADYDLATAHFNLGRVLKTGGAAEQALSYLEQAQALFEQLGEPGAGMASAALTEQGDCLRDLGRLDAAAAAYEERIECGEKQQDTRGVAVGNIQLSTVRMLQKRYADALEGYEEALALFSQLDEPASVATIWHQIGIVHRRTGDYPQAEQAYRQSLAIKIQQGNRAGEGTSLSELGNLYDAWNRPEQAVDFYRQSADLAVELEDQHKEGLRRSNLAGTLLSLQRYDEARPELLRAIECDKPFGHVAEPWKSWSTLRKLEKASGNLQAAREAQQQAVQAYLSYRRDGGENQSGGRSPQLCAAVLEAVQKNNLDEIGQAIAQSLAEAEEDYLKALLPKLQAILGGERDPALAEDESLDYDDAAELVLLLEKLQAAGL